MQVADNFLKVIHFNHFQQLLYGGYENCKHQEKVENFKKNWSSYAFNFRRFCNITNGVEETCDGPVPSAKFTTCTIAIFDSETMVGFQVEWDMGSKFKSTNVSFARQDKKRNIFPHLPKSSMSVWALVQGSQP